ncbi:hypothetical protein ACFOD8_01265 [Arthrobacter agilis]|uniref:hypothetical protein n=1 Tax=Arthrobacter agilis TaxID=37921 RepID=UPI0011789B3B|nr:hypothetical protein [Arthrobacter agilis]
MSAEPPRHDSSVTPALMAWSSVLDALEAAVDEAEAGELTPSTLVHQAAALGSWTPPRTDGPIPTALVARARGIRERQRTAIAGLAAEAGMLRRHRSALGTVQAATAPPLSSVYVDVTG